MTSHLIGFLFLPGGSIRAALHPRLQQRAQEDVRHPQAGGKDSALLQRFVCRTVINRFGPTTPDGSEGRAFMHIP